MADRTRTACLNDLERLAAIVDSKCRQITRNDDGKAEMRWSDLRNELACFLSDNPMDLPSWTQAERP